MADIVVAVPTFTRPQGLRRLLDALAALDTNERIAIIAADNDASLHEGFDLCERMKSAAYRWPLHAIIVPERGIAQVRNALVAAALDNPATQCIAMLDDDEWPDPTWLTQLLLVRRETDADVVKGSVRRVFDRTPPSWALNWEGIADIGTPADFAVEGTGNVLLDRRCFDLVKPPCFDPQFGLTGGEDRDFFVRLAASGARFAWAKSAVVSEHVPNDRLRLRWSLLRAYRTGNADIRIALKHARGPADLLREIAKIIGAFAQSILLTLLFGFAPTRRLDGLQKFSRAAGKVGALLGHRYYEYAGHNRNRS